MTKPKYWYCEMFKYKVWFCLRWKPEDFSKYMIKNHDYNRDYSSFGGACVLLNNPAMIIWTHPSDKQNISLVHECVHAANRILGERGHKIDADNDEVQAYLVEQIFRKALGK